MPANLLPTNAKEVSSTLETLQILKRYNAAIVDVWGTIYDGLAPISEMTDILVQYRKSGGKVGLLSNSPKSNKAALARLLAKGVDRSSFDTICTSGQMTIEWLKTTRIERVFHLGPTSNNSVLDEANVTNAKVEDAEIVLCSGLFDDKHETPLSYDTLFNEFLKHKMRMVCSNPDLKAPKGDQTVCCAGAVARRYGVLGGPVKFIGKPEKSAFQFSVQTLQHETHEEATTLSTIVVGDNRETDLKGAARLGSDCLFVAHYEPLKCWFIPYDPRNKT